MRFENSQVLSTVNPVANVNGNALDTSYWVASSAQAVVVGAGSLTGTLKYQFSDDIAAINPGGGLSTKPTNWTDVPSATVAVAGAGVYGIPKFDVAYQWLRLVFVYTSGTGTLTANVKSVGF